MSSREQSRSTDASERSSRNGEFADTVSGAVVAAVAEERNVSPDEMTPLYETVDPDALNQLFDSNVDRDPRIVAFEYEDCTVEIGCDRTLTVERASKMSD